MKPLLILAGAVTLIGIGFLLFSMYKQYTDSVYWEDHHADKVEMSQQPPSLLYDKNLTSKNAKLNFMSIYHTIYDEQTMDFKPDVKQEAIEQLQIELNQMTQDDYKKEYEQIFAKVTDKWAIESAYRNLFADSQLTTLRSDTTPWTILQVNEKTFEAIDDYATDSRNQDAFAKRIYAWQQKLLADALVINQKAATLSNWLTIDGQTATVQPDLYPAQFDTFSDEVAALELHYKWDGIQKLHALIAAIRPVTEAHKERHDLYVEVKADQAKKDEALAEVEHRLDTANANLQQAIQAIDGQRGQLKAEADALRAQQQTIEQQILDAEKAAEQARIDEENRLREEQAAQESRERQEQEERERPEESESSEESEESEESTEESQESEESEESQEPAPERDPILDGYIGKPAKEVFDQMTKTYTFERNGVEPSLEGAVIGSYEIKNDGTVHFVVVPE